MKVLHLVGLLLWRGGLLVAGGWIVLEVARHVVRFADLPRPLELASGMILAGALLVLGSILAERVADARREGDLRDPRT